MPFIIENNYILEASNRDLMALRIDTDRDSRLFIQKPFIDETIRLLEIQNDESDNKVETEEETIYRSSSNGPITIEELNKLYPEWEDILCEVDSVFVHEEEIISFPNVRLLLYQYLKDDPDEFYDILGRLLPDFNKYFRMYKERLSALSDRHLIWSQDWIGFTDSEKNIIYMSKNIDGTIKLEYIDTWSGNGESDDEFIYGSNIFNEFEINTVDQIKDKYDFLQGFKKLFSEPSKSDLANKIKIRKLEFEPQNLAEKINSVVGTFEVNPEEVMTFIDELKKK